MLKSYYQKDLLEAGCDEAGRGCLAGPVVGAAVILPKNFKHPKLMDSKQISKATRDELRAIIEEQALAYAVTFIGPKKIDQINILNASILAMQQSAGKLKHTPELLLIDGNRFKPYKKIPHVCIVKGDAKFQSIAAASILAKTYRDEFMTSLAKKFPGYGWERNKGYPTKDHRTGIAEIGATKHHRKSFKLLADQLSLDL